MTHKTVEVSDMKQDVLVLGEQSYRLPADYQYSRQAAWQKILSAVIRKPLKGFGWLVCRGWLHLHVNNPEVLKEFENQGYFLFINHTQPLGDPFLPAFLVGKKKFSSICLPANLKVPFFGPLLPWAGALPLPENREQMEAFRKEMAERIARRETIVIFPEGHVWPYCTFLREFPDTSFQYPIDLNVPSFCACVTYRKGKFRRPDMTVTIDGPFEPDPDLKRRAKRKDLCSRVKTAMESHFQDDDEAWIEYRIQNPDEQGAN